MIENDVLRIYSIITDIESISEQVLLYLEREDFLNFLEMINNREEKIFQLKNLRAPLTQWARNNLSSAEMDNLNKEINLKIENISKVDRKIFDIITCKQKQIGGKIHQATQGLNFLKHYKKQHKRENIITKTF